MVATAANTYISGSQFTFKWNFNIGERSHTESLIYMKPVLRREEQCTVCRDRRGRKLQETRLFSQMFILISMQWTKRRGHKRGWETRKIQITILASFPVPGGPSLVLWAAAFLQHSVSGPLFRTWGAVFLRTDGRSCQLQTATSHCWRPIRNGCQFSESALNESCGIMGPGFTSQGSVSSSVK